MTNVTIFHLKSLAIHISEVTSQRTRHMVCLRPSLSQLVRLCRINKTANYFKKDILKLVTKFVKHGFDKRKLRQKYLAFCSNYLSEWGRYGIDIFDHKFVKNLFV